MRGVGFLQDLLGALFERAVEVDDSVDDRPLPTLCEALLSANGEVSGHRIAGAILHRYESLDAAGRREFFLLLAERFDVDREALLEAARRYHDTPDSASYATLQACAEPRRQELFRRLNVPPGATARLVAMREALLGLLAREPGLARVDRDFQHLFASWFNRGFLVMRRIDWHSPASLLEKIIRYEAVHAIRDWDDLRRRLQPADRRCFAFFHPAMPDEPLIFVEVALTADVPDSIQAVLADARPALDPVRDPQAVSTAVFYSISNCQQGLRGVSFGNFLIKQVAHDLTEQLPSLRTFVTLSPVPGLVAWARASAPASPAGLAGETFRALIAIADGQAPPPAAGDEHAEQLQQLAAHYLTTARNRKGFPLDPVARFHLGNGASLDRVIWAADTSPKGLAESGGLMVNYRYELDAIESRHERYSGAGQIHTGRQVAALVAGKGARKARAPKGTG